MKGYTLLELMIAVVVIGLLVLAATSLFFSVARGGTKVQITAEVNQNGEIVLGTIERLIRNAYGVTDCISTASAKINLIDRYGGNIALSCEGVGTDMAYIASNGARLTSENVSVLACSFTCNEDVDEFRPPLVDIDFILSQARAAANPAEGVAQRFRTSVGLRNY